MTWPICRTACPDWSKPEADHHAGATPTPLPHGNDNQAEAEACFQRGLELASPRGAKSMELRSATALARLWRSQGKTKKFGARMSGFGGTAGVPARAPVLRLSARNGPQLSFPIVSYQGALSGVN